MDARTFTPEEKKTAVDIVCERVSSGESVRSILATGRPYNLPSFMVFLQWISNNEVWSKQYARAMEIRADLMFEEMLEISDTPEEGTKTKSSVNGIEVTSGDMVEHRKLKIDTRKWILARMNPKKYGDKNTVEISNPALDEVRAQFPNFKTGERAE